MFRFVQIVFLLVCLTIQYHLVITGTSRIIGGVAVEIEKVPYVVQISSDIFDGQFCGGALIAPDWVLTAAHCFYIYDVEDIYVRAGTKIRNEGGEVRNVIKLVKHPNYDRYKSGEYDIALLQMEKPFTLSNQIKAIEMADEEHEADIFRCRISGWGVLVHVIDSSAPPSNKLKSAFVDWVERNECIDKLPAEEITERMVCAGGDKKDSCQGDSGGPLTCNNKLTGVIAFGVGCGSIGIPGVYTRIVSFRPWIKEVAGI